MTSVINIVSHDVCYIEKITTKSTKWVVVSRWCCGQTCLGAELEHVTECACVHACLQVDGHFPSTTRTLQEEGNLTIVHLNHYDQGVYECVASNAVAQSVTSAVLIVHRK